MNRISSYPGYLIKIILLYVLIFSSVSAQSQSFTTNGSTTDLGGNCFTLTPNQNGQNGSVWYSKQIDLRSNFDIYYSVFLGTNPNGADGMAFVLQSVSNTVQGSSGSGMGYGGIAPSLDLEYDTYPNTDFQAYDPNYDHICIMKNGEFHHNSGQLVSPVPLNASGGGTVKDGQYHNCRTTWDVANKTLTVYFDGVQLITYSGDIINNLFSGKPGVYFGFTASTGGLSNQQGACINLGASTFKELSASTTPFDMQLTSTDVTCGNGNDGTASATFSGGTSPYSFDGWTYPNGTVGGTTPTITNLVAGTYTAAAHDALGTSIVKSIVVKNASTPPPTITPSGPTTFCQGGSVTLTASGGLSYAWSSGESSQAINVTTSGTFSVTVTSTTGCSSTSNPLTIIVNPLPTITTNAPITTTSGSTVNLTASGGTAYSWSGPQGFASTLSNPSLSAIISSNSGLYTVTGSDGNGCSATSVTSILVNSIPGAALDFNGTNNFVSLNSSIGNVGTGDFTIEMKVKTSLSSAYLLSKRNICGADNFISMQVLNGHAAFELSDIVSDLPLQGVSVINDDQWHQVSVSRLSGVVTLYVDGVVEATGNSLANINNSYSMTLGAGVCTGTSGYLAFNGRMDEVRFWNRAVCQAQIVNNKNCELGIVGPDLSAYYQFNQGFGNDINTGLTTLNDLSGNHNDGTLINFSLTGSNSNWIAPGAVTSGISCNNNVAPAPTITGATSITRYSNSTSCNATGNYAGNITITNGDFVSFTLSGKTTGSGNGTGSDQTFNPGITNVIITATNSCGTVTANFAVTVSDSTPPVPDLASLVDINGACSVTLTPPTATDNCSGKIIATTTNPMVYDKQGSYVVVWTYKDSSGNQSIQAQNVLIKDNILPNISAPADVIVNTDHGSNVATNVNIGTPVTSDNCSVGNITNDAPVAFPAGTTAVKWTVTDVNGNKATSIQTVTVKDAEAPVAIVSSSITKNNDPGICGAVVNYPQIFVTDNVSTTSMTISAGDADGVLTFNTPLLNNVNGINFVAYGDFDDIAHGHGKNISVLIELYNPLTAAWVAVQTIQTGTGDFHFGGTASNFPLISQVSQIRFTASEFIGAAFHLYQLKININSIKVIQTSGLPSGSVCPVGTTLNTFQTIDADGNASSASFTVRVVDNEKPQINGYLSTTHSMNYNCSWSGVAGTINVTDNCSSPLTLTENDIDAHGNILYSGQYTVPQGMQSLPLRNYPLGVNTVQLSVRDASGNISNTATFTVTVTDNTNPTIVSSGNIIASADPGACHGYVVVPLPVTSDNCGVQAVTNSFNGTPNATDNYPVGTTVITWTATDGSGNRSTTTQSITVRDNEAPIIFGLPQNIIQTNDAGRCGAVVNWSQVLATDNCGLTSFISNHHSGEFFPVGVTTITFTATDVHNNTSTASFTITVTDNEAPVVISKPLRITLVNGIASINASDLNNGSTDNCGSVTFSASKTSFSCRDVGVNMVTLTVTDSHGNVAATTAPVTVVGDVPTSSILVTPSNNTFTGGVPTNIYLGYGPQTVSLKDSVVGTSAVTYTWSGSGISCSTCAAPVFTPVIPNMYNFNVTARNTYGCTTSSTVSICVRDIRVPGTNNVYVCHTDISTGTLQTLTLGTAAVTNDLNTYPQDNLGICGLLPCSTIGALSIANADTSNNPPVSDTKTSARLVAEPLIVHAYPNPTQDIFYMKIISNNKEVVRVRLLDENGKVLQVIDHAPIGNNFRIGNNITLIAGVYFAEIIQGDQRLLIKLLKMR